ncbi:MAG: ATP-dependent Clp protease ATP-binding subunit, partial [Oscillospiraceae bacterium]|nr:ATP-dependent Clp protease ATP-binding subunit [Oscillospiraceae bacterium]
MKPTLCSRCNKNVAVIFITKIENGRTTNEGLCLKCAKDLGIKQVDDMVKQMGISDEDLENLSGEMMSMLGGNPNQDPDVPEDEDMDGQTATFPFLNKLFGGMMGQGSGNVPAPRPEQPKTNPAPPAQPPKKKHKFLDAYCLDLTERAREGKLDRIVGREEETERVIQILNRRQKNNPCLIGEPG